MLGKKKKSKLKKRVLAMVLLFSIAPLCIFGAFSLYETSRKIDELTECNLNAISKNQIINIQKFAERRKSAMSTIASYDLVVDAAQDSLDGKEKDQSGYFDNLLQQQVNHADYVVSVSILDRDFHVVGSSEQYELQAISKMRILDDKYHTGEFIMGDVYERETNNGVKRVVPAYIGIYNKDTLIGYVVEELDTTYFDELRLNMKSLSEGTFYLLDGTNNIITGGQRKTRQAGASLFLRPKTEMNSTRNTVRLIMRNTRRVRLFIIMVGINTLPIIQMYNTQSGAFVSVKICQNKSAICGRLSCGSS